jgi:hypothetical protein
MTFSGPNACRGSMKEARIFPHFLHSARSPTVSGAQREVLEAARGLTRHRRRKGIVDTHGCFASRAWDEENGNTRPGTWLLGQNENRARSEVASRADHKMLRSGGPSGSGGRGSCLELENCVRMPAAKQRLFS